MLEELCKRIQHCCATLRQSRNKRNVGSCWLKSLTGFKLCATTSNNMQQGVQTDATCNIQQCWELLANNVTSVWERRERGETNVAAGKKQTHVKFPLLIWEQHIYLSTARQHNIDNCSLTDSSDIMEFWDGVLDRHSEGRVELIRQTWFPNSLGLVLVNMRPSKSRHFQKKFVNIQTYLIFSVVRNGPSSSSWSRALP